MRFRTSEKYDYWPFEGINYKVHLNMDDLSDEKKWTVGLEMRMMDWLEDNMISHAWSIEDTITFKRERDRLMFILKFS